MRRTDLTAWSLTKTLMVFCAGLKKYRMVFPAGLRDPCTRDVARLSESVKILELQASVFLRFPKVEQHPKCMDHAILLGKPFGNCFIK